LSLKRGMKFIRLSITFDHDTIHDTTNAISGWSTRVLDFLLKRSLSENIHYKD
jgi:hypothetical protein